MDIYGMNKIIITTIFAFTLGFFSNRLFTKSSLPEPLINLDETRCDVLHTAKDNLISMSKNEYIEYTKIKDLKQKYEKADELLGKVMLLFLADVGFQLQRSADNTLPMDQSLAIDSDQFIRTKDDTIEELKPVKSIDPVTATLEGKSSTIKNMQTEKQIIAILDQSIIDHPKVEAAKGRTPKPVQIKFLEGRYTGFIRFLDKKRENLNIVWDLIPDSSRKPELTGTFNLSIRGPGINKDLNSNGTLLNILSLAEDQEGFLIQGCGVACYLQLYYNSPAEKFFGNYYESVKGSDAKATRVGIIELKR